jgi:hypothetical protein
LAADDLGVLILQIVAGLFAWLLAGFGVALLFKTRLLNFQVRDDRTLEVSPAMQVIAVRARR